MRQKERKRQWSPNNQGRITEIVVRVPKRVKKNQRGIRFILQELNVKTRDKQWQGQSNRKSIAAFPSKVDVLNK